MSGFEMFCERCGKRYGSEYPAAAASMPLAKRLLKAVGVAPTVPEPHADEPFLRFCLACRGYSCPTCWNEEAGFCQTCVPMPEIVVEAPAPEPVYQAPTLVAEPAYDTPLARLEQWAPEAPVAPAFAEFEPVEVRQQPAALEPVALEPVALEPVEFETVSVEPEQEPIWAEPEPILVEAATEPLFGDITPEAQPEPVQLAAFEADGVPEPEAVLAEAAAVSVEDVLAEIVAEPPDEELAAAMAQRPIELILAEEEPVSEPEPEVDWHVAFAWDEDAPATFMPDVAGPQRPTITFDVPQRAFAAEPPPAPSSEPAPVTPVAEPPGPVAPTEPYLAPPPIFKPLPPLGPILPPPPPPAAPVPVPRMEFDLPDAPPAYVIAPPQPPFPTGRPIIPAGLFDGPGPSIRPCSNCDLPVSAKARFCRRCGSAQAAN